MTGRDTTERGIDSAMRIVIVGGVAAGMSCAARARRLSEDAEIIVLERGPHVSFANCGLPYFIGGEIEESSSLLVQTPESLQSSLNLDVRPRHEVIGMDATAKTVTVRSPTGVEELGYDALVLAPGAAAVRPPIPGLDSERVHTVRSVPEALAVRDAARPGARAVVIGGGFIGVETAEALAERGLAVAILEASAHILPPLEPELAHMVRSGLEAVGVAVLEGMALAEVHDRARTAHLRLSDGTTLESELVILSAGVRPDTALFEAAGVPCERGAIVVDEHGRTGVPGVWAAGDAVLSTDAVTGERRPVALAGPANRAGRLVADDILRPASARPIPRPLGTAIVRAGRLSAAMTGANRRSLQMREGGIQTIHLHPADHATYFPGAEEMALVVHFAEDDGRILGAQAVGGRGVDKRIDLLGTAIRAGWHIDDLIDLDLAYSPPYGQAKDPVNLVGLLGQNVAEGNLRLWYAGDLDAVRRSSLLVDVRTRGEFLDGHVRGAINVPHTELRARLAEIRELAAGRPVRVLCATGMRSYLAHRVLAQSGFDSASLSGGMKTLRAELGNRADEEIVVAESQPVA